FPFPAICEPLVCDLHAVVAGPGFVRGVRDRARPYRPRSHGTAGCSCGRALPHLTRNRSLAGSRVPRWHSAEKQFGFWGLESSCSGKKQKNKRPAGQEPTRRPGRNYRLGPEIADKAKLPRPIRRILQVTVLGRAVMNRCEVVGVE